MANTVLILGEIDEAGVPNSALAHFGAEAYESYMVAPYARELLAVRHSDYICWSPSFNRLHAAATALGAVQFEELGSTLFSTIDKFDKLGPIPGIEYFGIEISALLISLADALHPGHRIRHYATWQEIPSTTRPIISRSYQSTSYAFRTTAELFAWVSRAHFGIHGIWWCIDGGERQTTMLGNNLTLFDPDLFLSMAIDQRAEVKVLKADTFTHGDVRFSAAWVSFSRKPTDLDAICDLSRLALSVRQVVGQHANFTPIVTGRPFDFSALASTAGIRR